MTVQSKGTDSSSGLKRFFEQNKTLVFLLPILLVLSIVVIIIYIPKGNSSNKAVPAAADNSARQGSKVEILPQTERVTDETAAAKQEATSSKSEPDTVKDPFVGPMSFTGVVTNSNGNNIAIIEGSGKTYLVRKGDTIGDNVAVDSITADKVVLKEGERTITLNIEQNKNSQTVSK